MLGGGHSVEVRCLSNEGNRFDPAIAASFHAPQCCRPINARQVEKPVPPPHHDRRCDAIRTPHPHDRRRRAAWSPVLNDHPTPPPITLYTTAICPYCVSAKNFLKSKGLDWTEIRIDTDPAERERMIARAQRTSVPQIFVGDVHVGGFDDMMELHRAGRFEPLLAGGGA